MKKVLSLVLVIAMVLSSMSFAFAAKFEDIADTDYEKAIETLTALGIVTGYEDGTYRPEKVVTRAEMAKLLVEALGYGDLVAGSKSNFSDTQGHWADAWIALAAGKGLVIGTGDGKFTPDRTVSYDEVLTMLVRGLGYTDSCNEIKGTWPSNFKVKAAELGITKNVKLSSTGADRGGVAQAIFNALEATLVTVDTDGNVVKIVDTVDGDKSDRILLSRLADKKVIEVSPEMLDKTSKKYVGEKVDLEPYMYQTLETYVNYTDKDANRYEVVYVRKSNSVVLEGTVSDILDKNGDSVVDDAKSIAAKEEATIVVEDAKEKEFDMVIEAKDSLRAFYNGEEETLKVEDLEKLLYDNSAAKITVIVYDANDNGKADNGESPIAAVVEKATVGVQASVDYQGKLKVSGVKGSITLPEGDDGKVDLDNVKVVGAVDSLDDIKADDIVIAYESISGDVVKLAVSRNTVEGTVTKTNGDADVVYIDGTKYEVSEVKNSIGAKVIEAGDEGVFYLDDAGKVFAVDTDGAELTDYAVVTDYTNGEVVTSGKLNKSINRYAKITLLTASGDKVTYNILSSFDGDELDDAATLEGVDGETKLINANLTVVDITGELIKYSIDEDNYIDEVEVVPAGQQETIDTDDIDDITTENTVAFYKTPEGKYEVVKLSSVSDGKATVSYYSSGVNKGKIAAILTTSAKSENDSKYGVIKSVNYVTNSKGDKVVEVTALVDGEEVKFLTAKGKETGKLLGDYTLSKTTTATAVKFELNASDVLTGLAIIPDNDDNDIFTNIKDIDSQEVTLSDDTVKYYTSDVAVYIYDQSDKAWSIGDTSDIDDNFVGTTAYSFDGSSRISLVVQVVK